MKNKKYHIITIGCQMNKSDSERVAGCLEGIGYKEEINRDKAGLIVLNTCGVRQSAEDRVYGLVGKIKKENPRAKIILCGCLSQRKDVKKRLGAKIDIWLPIIDLPKLSQKLGFDKTGYPDDYLKIGPVYKSKISAYVPIGNGCDNFCTYCVVPMARGREVYRRPLEIIAESKKLVQSGYKEIFLIAQNVNSYKSRNMQHATRNNKLKEIYFFNLLRMVNEIRGDFWIRFATSHPKDMSGDLIDAIAECDKACKHIHLPAQSGDNEVLKTMNRGYSREKYLSLIKEIRKKIPNASITTDIIVGFPGETKEQFKNTVKLFEEVKFDMAYIARYSPRPGTSANSLIDDVSSEEKKEREERLMEVLRKTARENNERYLNKDVKILINNINKKSELFGRTDTNKVVKVKLAVRHGKKDDLIGKFVKAKIKKARDFGLEGVLI